MIDFRGVQACWPATSRAILRGVPSDPLTLRLERGLVNPKTQDLVVGLVAAPLHGVPVDNPGVQLEVLCRACGEVLALRGQAVYRAWIGLAVGACGAGLGRALAAL